MNDEVEERLQAEQCSICAAEEVKSVMWQLTQCIKYLHDLHIWHRDLKSQNVFISWENGELVAKVRGVERSRDEK